MSKRDIKYILGCVRRADQDFAMIQPGDRILIGISGGKDSLMLAHMLALYGRFSKKEFQLQAATLNLGLKQLDFDALKLFCENLGIPYAVRDTNIGQVVFESRQEKNPCALCAKMRRGALVTLANELGCNKIALGHQREDVLETFFLSLLHEGRLHTFSPTTPLDRNGVTQIRPLIYAEEKRVLAVARELGFPIQQSACTVAGKTRREDMKNLIRDLNRQMSNADEMIFRAIAHPESYGLWKYPENE